jgi:acyl carrier protein
MLMPASYSKNINNSTMNKEELIEKLKVIVKPYTNNQEAYDNMNEDTDFINDLKINSANLVDIILDIEEAFDITIDNAEMERMLNVKAAIEIVEAKI